MSSQATTTTPTQPLSSSTCCDSGRPIITDPLTGQTVCSCQYDSQAQQLLNYQRLASGLPLNVYGAPYGEQSYLPLTAEQSAFYAPSENLGTWPYPASMYYPYDPTLSGYPFANGYIGDGARRKNATRETTSTLKAWLSEHRKNPYPTKGEKIMLAIITKMTLTQVSTWFANARRRLKKENKVTWEPRNRVDDDDNDDASDTNERETTKMDKESKNNENGFSSACQKPSSLVGNCDTSDGQRNKSIDVEDDDLCLGNGGGTMDTSQRDSMSSPGSSILSDSHSSLQSPALTDSPGVGLTPTGGLHDAQGHLKPRIWSIVDTATSHGNSNSNLNSNFVGFGVSGAGLFAHNSGGGGGKVSQQFARNLRLGYASPYSKAAWLNGAFATVASSMPVTAVSSSSSSSSDTTTLSPTTSAYPSSMCAASPSSSALTTTSGLGPTTAMTNGQSVEACNLMMNPIVKSTMAATATATSYPMSIAAAAAAAHSNANMNVNSALFSRTYAQTIHNLTNLTKGLNHLMAPQLGNAAYMGAMKTAPVQQDQRSELQSSTS